MGSAIEVSRTIPARLRALADATPDRTALVVDGVGSLTFGEWYRAASAIARGLDARDVQLGDRVVILCGDDWLSFGAAFAGVLLTGGVAVPVPTLFGTAHVETVCGVTNPAGIVGELAALPAGVPWAATVEGLSADQSSAHYEPIPLPADDAQILGTSGTTDMPKGVAASHAELLFHHRDSLVDAPPRVVLHALPAAMEAGHSAFLQALDLLPHTVVALPDYTDARFAAAIERHRATNVIMVPAQIRTFVHSEAAAAADKTSVVVVRSGGAAVPAADLMALADLFGDDKVWQVYKSTESGSVALSMPFDRAHPSAVGRITGATKVRIVDDDGHVLPPGEMGQIQMSRSDVPSRHYVGVPKSSQAVFLSGGWVGMGDIGHVDGDLLYVDARASEVASVAALKVSPREVEDALREYPGVIDAAVCSIGHDDIPDSYIAAGIRLDRRIKIRDLIGHMRTRVGVRAPTRIYVFEDFPVTAMGKVIKKELAKMIVARADAQVAPEGATESPFYEPVRQIFEDALRRDLGPDSDFLKSGGGSLLSREITTRIGRELGRDVDPDEIFYAGTLGAFVLIVENAPDADPSKYEDRIKRRPRQRTDGGAQ